MLDKLFYFIINFAKKRDTATAVANYSGHGYVKKQQQQQQQQQKHSDTRKTTATYNKLLDETRDEHYYILNR